MTHLLGIFGYPIGHTLSPLLHQAAFRALGLPYHYLPFEVAPEKLKDAVMAIITLKMKGVNITRPHKETIIPYLYRLTKDAKNIGAVNTIELINGRPIGHNTDGAGFLQSLKDEGIDPAGMRVILLGAGGAARAVAVSLLTKKIDRMIIMARSPKQGTGLANDLSSLCKNKVARPLRIEIAYHPFDNKKSFSDEPTLFINTTPLGMKRSDPYPYSPNLLHPTWMVADLIYSPHKTALVLAAEKRGLKIVPGIGMLLHQGALSFEIWTKKKAPIEVMRNALRSHFHGMA